MVHHSLRSEIAVIMGPDAVRARFPVNGTAHTSAATMGESCRLFRPGSRCPNGGLACALASCRIWQAHHGPGNGGSGTCARWSGWHGFQLCWLQLPHMQADHRCTLRLYPNECCMPYAASNGDIVSAHSATFTVRSRTFFLMCRRFNNSKRRSSQGGAAYPLLNG
jgi:hypothetical protein